MKITIDRFKLFLESRGVLNEFKNGVDSFRKTTIEKWFNISDKDDVIIDSFHFDDVKKWFKINDEWIDYIYSEDCNYAG